MKIFIAGCGRSGTTLLRRLMATFSDTYTHEGEAKHFRLDKLKVPNENVVVKRTNRCWETLHELPPDRALIYSIRHPLDVLTSKHPATLKMRPFHITPERWSDEFSALKRLRQTQPNRKICVVRYERLVTTPDSVQQKIAEQLGLNVEHRFSENPEGLEFSLASKEKWKRDPALRRYLMELPFPTLQEIGEFCEEFNYRVPKFLFKRTEVRGKVNVQS